MSELDKARKRFQDDVQEYGTEWRDAEIERLRAEGLRVLKLYNASLELLVEKDNLIAELADALSCFKSMLHPPHFDLLQRAREAALKEVAPPTV